MIWASMKKAIEYFDKALATNGTFTKALNKGVLYNKGIALEGLGKYEEAIEYFDKALAINGNFTDALINKGLVLHELGESQEAIEYFDKALAINENDEQALYYKRVAMKDLQDENQTDFTLVVENATSEPNITKFELKGESFDQICPSHQCEIVKHTYTHFSLSYSFRYEYSLPY